MENLTTAANDWSQMVPAIRGHTVVSFENWYLILIFDKMARFMQWKLPRCFK